jgi:hypothetical protein
LGESEQEIVRPGASWLINTSRCYGGSPASSGCRAKTQMTLFNSPGYAAWNTSTS